MTASRSRSSGITLPCLRGSSTVPPSKARGEVVLVSDVYMPGGTAIKAVETLQETLDGLPIIFITSAKDVDITEHGIRVGATAVLSKPVDMDELKRLIRRIIGCDGAEHGCVTPPHEAR